MQAPERPTALSSKMFCCLPMRLLKSMTISREEATAILRIFDSGETTHSWSEGTLRLMNAADSETSASQPPTQLHGHV
ncbi:hypothetical protein SCLCIDRAFT_183454 [Scleroderma citrinum Foug A]|uniref:Uncharacterized protein n=1 Tax=Scleroderma citrinum Foug A TaxID=1036808 RepID=A0A0C2ZXT2_9AGAM|nr:hypothetical protein SCLCIDRAFT_183454 [Scleroderma citrinum Foug A]